TGAALPGSQAAAVIPGSPDGLVQAATYRLCVTDDPSNRIPFTAPAGDRPSTYALFGRALPSWQARTGSGPAVGSVLNLMPLPDRERDLNSRGLFSTDVVDGSAAWSSVSDEQRAAIAASDRAWEAGLLWFLQTDPAVPGSVRTGMA